MRYAMLLAIVLIAVSCAMTRAPASEDQFFSPYGSAGSKLLEACCEGGMTNRVHGRWTASTLVIVCIAGDGRNDSSPMVDVNVCLMDEASRSIQRLRTDGNGRCSVTAHPGRYVFVACLNGFKREFGEIVIDGHYPERPLVLSLEPDA